MSSFGAQLRQFTAKVEARSREIFVGVAVEAHRSIQTGSEITGAPGQPVGQYGPGYHEGKVGGTLRNSWQLVFEAQDAAMITSNIVYAPPIEDGVGRYGPMQVRSTVGGFHSRALTIANLDRIVEHVTRQVVGNG